MNDYWSQFERVELPPILDRIALPWKTPLSIPFVGDDEVDYPLSVFKSKFDWRIEVKGILDSDIGMSFDSHAEALSYALHLLELKGIVT